LKEHGRSKIEDWEVEVLRKEGKQFDRKFYEAVYISKVKGVINKSSGILIV
jgi:hypothetical protein